MAQLDLTTALARLLSDASLREAYRQDRRGTAAHLAVRAADRSSFLSLDPDLLDRQADTLLNKRLHEVRRLLPDTFTRVGAEAPSLFRTYAQTRWPVGHMRHVDDAVAFCRHLMATGTGKVNRAELNRMRFVLRRQRLAVHLVPDLMRVGHPRPGVQLLYCPRGQSPRQFVLTLDILSGVRRMLAVPNMWKKRCRRRPRKGHASGASRESPSPAVEG